MTTKKEMVQAIADELGLYRSETLAIIQRVLDGIIQTLVLEGRVELRNFGVFEVKKRKPRKARNPRTGEPVDVPARLVVSFKAGRAMQEQVNRSGHVPGEEPDEEHG
jgi:nucleoid DNA-binding protein